MHVVQELGDPREVVGHTSTSMCVCVLVGGSVAHNRWPGLWKPRVLSSGKSLLPRSY